LTYFIIILASLPYDINFFMAVVNNYFELLSSSKNYSPGALYRKLFLFTEKFVKCIYISLILFVSGFL